MDLLSPSELSFFLLLCFLHLSEQFLLFFIQTSRQLHVIGNHQITEGSITSVITLAANTYPVPASPAMPVPLADPMPERTAARPAPSRPNAKPPNASKNSISRFLLSLFEYPRILYPPPGGGRAFRRPDRSF